MNVVLTPPNSVFPMTHAKAAADAAGSNVSSPLQDTQGMFMQLLTAQLQNQSPLNPIDPSQFTSQLVEFNMLDQLAQINQTLKTALAPLATTASGGGSNQSTQGVL